MNSKFIRAATAVTLMMLGDIVFAQDEQLITIPLSRPGEVMWLDVSILSARIEVIGEDRKDAEFSVSVTNRNRKIITPTGTKALVGGSYALDVEEENNRISIDTDWRANKVNLIARIPREANLELSTTNNGEIIVRDVIGDLELSNVNGPITASNITGSVIAETVNETIDVSFAKLSDSKPMAFTTMNGDLKLGLPARTGVQIHIDNARGEIYSDFEVEVQPTKAVVERKANRRGVEVTVESVIVADINGGGPIIKLKSLNGDIQINKSSN